MLTVLQCPGPQKMVWLKYKLSNVRPLKIWPKPCLLRITLFNNRKCHSLSLKVDNVLRLLLILCIFEVIFRTNEWQVRTAWLGMTNEVALLIVCSHPALAAGLLKSPGCNGSSWGNNCICHLLSPSLTSEGLSSLTKSVCCTLGQYSTLLALVV